MLNDLNTPKDEILVPIASYPWDKVINDVTAVDYDSHQVFHTKGTSIHYTALEGAVEFVNTYLQHAKSLYTDADVLRYASDCVSIQDGIYLEMGVATGRTINFIAALNPTKRIYGFDSFEGLPEAWDRGDDLQHPTGAYAIINKDYIPNVLKNVTIYKGMFSDVLPKFKKQILGDKPISFLHIDCDVYKSTQCIFNILGDHIVSGTVIIFDELYNYPNYKEGEWKALQEFLTARNLKANCFAFNAVNEQVALQIQ